jgi:hypothetical protein
MRKIINSHETTLQTSFRTFIIPRRTHAHAHIVILVAIFCDEEEDGEDGGGGGV